MITHFPIEFNAVFKSSALIFVGDVNFRSLILANLSAFDAYFILSPT